MGFVVQSDTIGARDHDLPLLPGRIGVVEDHVYSLRANREKELSGAVERVTHVKIRDNALLSSRGTHNLRSYRPHQHPSKRQRYNDGRSNNSNNQSLHVIEFSAPLQT
jgi:hypothetical protein